MHRSVLLVATLCAASSGALSSATDVSGDTALIIEDTLWGPDASPYNLFEEVHVADGVRLIIDAGAVVNGYDAEIVVFGELKVVGAEDKPAVFNDVIVRNGKGGYVNVKFAEVNRGAITTEGTSHNSSVSIRDSVLRQTPHVYIFYPLRLSFIERNVFHGGGGVSIGTDEVRVTVRNNVFMSQTTDYAVEAWAAYPRCRQKPGDPNRFNCEHDMIVVEENTFVCPNRVALRLRPGYHDARMVVRNNFFGGARGESAVRAMLYDKNNDPKCSEIIRVEETRDAPHPSTPPPPAHESECDGEGGSIPLQRSRSTESDGAESEADHVVEPTPHRDAAHEAKHRAHEAAREVADGKAREEARKSFDETVEDLSEEELEILLLEKKLKWAKKKREREDAQRREEMEAASRAI